MSTGWGKIGPALTRLAAVLSVCLLAACAGAPASDQSASGQSASNRHVAQIDPKPGDGLGGTGIAAQTVVAHVNGDGLGGTGIIGTISGFGSIIVNGLELEYDGRTAVQTDGALGNLEDLKIGQVIQGVARRTGDKLYLDKLEMQHAVTGPIEAIDHDAQSLTVLGQRVRANLGGDKAAAEAFRTLTRGDMVSISGLRQADGTIIATRVDQQPADGRVIVRGTAHVMGDGTVKLGDLEIGRGPSAAQTDVVQGGRVFASGRMVDGRFVADVIVGSAPLPFGDGVKDVSIEAYLPNTAASPLMIEGVNVEGAVLPPDATAGDRLIVNGRISGANRVTATSIDKIKTFVTILKARGSLRPAAIRPDANRRPERMVAPPRPVVPERPNVVRPERERPESVPMG